MKRALLIAISVLMALGATTAPAAEREVNLLFTGGPEQNVIFIQISPDGRSYVITSSHPLEAGGGICLHSEGLETQLTCEATPIAGFEVNAGGGHDQVIFSPKITVPVTLRGGPGHDRLRGGAAADKLVGGEGRDDLFGMGGDDWVFGGPGEDYLHGGPGNDRLIGGPGSDYLHGGPGADTEPIGVGDYDDSIAPPKR